jgi:hypothetical protein
MFGRAPTSHSGGSLKHASSGGVYFNLQHLSGIKHKDMPSQQQVYLQHLSVDDGIRQYCG